MTAPPETLQPSQQAAAAAIRPGSNDTNINIPNIPASIRCLFTAIHPLSKFYYQEQLYPR